jgi:hypothetical protein
MSFGGGSMRIWIWAVLAALAAGPTSASDQSDRERALKESFEGRSVTVRIDMPATEKGIDVRVGESMPIDTGTLGDRLAEAGVSIREGARVPVTKVHIKDDLIEFQLAGGGFDWLWNTQGSVSPQTGKSGRERDLERRIKEERDPDRRRELERELRDARYDRERDERRSREAAEEENRRRRQEDHERALLRGSRFNLRWDGRVPPEAQTPEAVMLLLSPWVDFSGFPGAPLSPPRSPAAEAPAQDQDVRAGMSWLDVQDRWGAPDRLESSSDRDLRRSVATYGGHGVELTFVNDILVKIRPLGAEPR